MKTAIRANEKDGCVWFHAGSKQLMVSHPDEDIRKKVKSYLTTKRYFTVPMPGTERGITRLIAVPTDNDHRMSDALTEMYHKIGVRVVWNDPDNEE